MKIIGYLLISESAEELSESDECSVSGSLQLQVSLWKLPGKLSGCPHLLKKPSQLHIGMTAGYPKSDFCHSQRTLRQKRRTYPKSKKNGG